jgi:DNA-binding response OmpR family regulator
LTQPHDFVLLVEDQDNVRRALTRMLVSADIQVVGAPNGELALQEVRRLTGLPGLLITDISMPIMNGFDLARAFRSIHPTVPILLMTGLNCRASGLQADRLGLELLLKPFGPEVFLDIVTRLLGQARVVNRSLA